LSTNVGTPGLQEGRGELEMIPAAAVAVGDEDGVNMRDHVFDLVAHHGLAAEGLRELHGPGAVIVVASRDLHPRHLGQLLEVPRVVDVLVVVGDDVVMLDQALGHQVFVAHLAAEIVTVRVAANDADADFPGHVGFSLI
jgi:hypothetical protein